MKQIIFTTVLLSILTHFSFAQNITPASIFGNNMVIQQGINAPIWGTASPKEVLSISFAGSTQKTTADVNGKWMVRLAKTKAGGPYKMKIATKKDAIVYDSVFVGEVWLAGGQSNMQFRLSEGNNAGKEIADANYPEIRFFTVGLNISSKPLSDVKGQWLVSNPANARNFSAAAYFFARQLHLDKKVPVGIISSSWGSSPAEAWTSGISLLTNEDFRDSILRYQAAQANWEILYTNYLALRDSVQKNNLQSTIKPVLPAEKNYPSALYNAMIAPLVPYGIKGVIWYQGENNGNTAIRAFKYRTIFPLLINDWRARWNNDSLPFIYVQLANHKAKNPQPVMNDNWATLRESQSMTLKLPNTGMAVTIDIGDANNIHPKNKQDVGKRLYLAANHIAYHANNVYSGPRYLSMNMLADKIELSFEHVGSGLDSKGQALAGFAIAGEDKKFYWANAVIEGNKIIVSCKDVQTPVAVRYAWAVNPDANLYNKEGLPASPFRTDNW